jgi:hypothetical protein
MVLQSGDLVILVADKNMDDGLRRILARAKALGIRDIRSQVFVHVRRDPGCVRESGAFLRPFTGQYARALVMFDHRGSGREDLSAEALAVEVRGRVAESGWDDRVEVIVLDPELETWVFASSAQVERCLGWTETVSMRLWLEKEGLWEKGSPKPTDPRVALERVLFKLQRPRSSALYGELATRVSLKACGDPAFLRLRETLVRWFPREQTA